MDIKRAIEMMRQEQESIIHLRDQGVFPKTPLDGTYYEALEMGISALKKQIPQKPDMTDANSMCPRCGFYVGGRYYEYAVNNCPCCGQKIDWSNDPVKRRNSIAIACGMESD